MKKFNRMKHLLRIGLEYFSVLKYFKFILPIKKEEQRKSNEFY